RCSRTPVPTTGIVVFSDQRESYHRKNITLRDYMLIVTSHTVGRRSDPKDRRDTTLASTYPENPSSSSPTFPID
ncbi:hypothetical protein X777_08106, partial [Ooceraea biroi]